MKVKAEFTVEKLLYTLITDYRLLDTSVNQKHSPMLPANVKAPESAFHRAFR